MDGGSAPEALRMLTGAPLTSFQFSDPSVLKLIQGGPMEILIKDFLSKRSFVVVATSQPVGIYCRDSTSSSQQYASTISNSNAGGNSDEVLPPKGSAFVIIGMRR